MEYMEAQMQNYIEVGISENDRLRMVNQQLVAALQNIMNGITSGAITSDYDETMERAVIQAHEALALVKGEPPCS